MLVKVVSNRLGDEQVDALDFGWRHQFNRTTAVDLTAFSYQYRGLRGVTATAPQLLPPGYLLASTTENNANSARVQGMEAAVDWRASASWRLRAHYTWLKADVTTANIPGQVMSDYAGTTPTHQVSLRSSLDLAENLRWDAALRRVSSIRNENFTIPAFTALDMRLAWQARKDLELSVVGQNLLDPAHSEFGGIFIRSTPVEIQRAVYVRADWKF
jgi:iron complex outermembrane receptor protein